MYVPTHSFLIHRPKGSEPLSFQLGALSHTSTHASLTLSHLLPRSSLLSHSSLLSFLTLFTDPKGSEPFSFQLGALPHFKTEDQSKHGEFVRVLGLGGSMAYDWSADSRKPHLVGVQDDYVTFDGGLVGGVYLLVLLVKAGKGNVACLLFVIACVVVQLAGCLGGGCTQSITLCVSVCMHTTPTHSSSAPSLFHHSLIHNSNQPACLPVCLISPLPKQHQVTATTACSSTALMQMSCSAPGHAHTLS